MEPDPYSERRKIAKRHVEEVYAANMAILPVEVQSLINAIPIEAAKRILMSNINSMMETSDAASLQHLWILLAGNLSYAHASGHFDDEAFQILVRLRDDLRSRKYISSGPFLKKRFFHDQI